jgi:hypothetical protein
LDGARVTIWGHFENAGDAVIALPTFITFPATNSPHPIIANFGTLQ